MTATTENESASEDRSSANVAPRIKLWHALALVASGFVVYSAIVPLFDDLHRLKFYRAHYTTAVIERIVESVIAFWFFALGTCIGSFLNVVVYRLPHRLPITGSSFCPRCSKTISWHDNIPIFSWLRLRAACRHCRLPISARYPFVELAVGVTFFALAIMEIGMASVNLPFILKGRTGFGLNLLSVAPPLSLIFICHCHCLAALAANGLMVRDARQNADLHRLPIAPTAYAMLAIVVIRSCWPSTNVFAIAEVPSIFSNATEMGRGLGLGFAAGCSYWLAFAWYPTNSERRLQNTDGWRNGIVLGFVLVGLTFDWQSLAQFAVILNCVHLLFAVRKIIPCCQSINPVGHFAIAAITFTLCWRWIPQSAFVGWSHVLLILSLAAAAGVVGAFTSQSNTPTVHRIEQLDRV